MFDCESLLVGYGKNTRLREVHSCKLRRDGIRYYLSHLILLKNMPSKFQTFRKKN